MKRKYLSVAAILLCAGSIMFSSCIGSFSLTNKLLSWNRQVGNKFVNELVFVAFWILPVYEVSVLADYIVINSIEFWSGTNPVAQGKSHIKGSDGTLYLVDCDGKGYTITNENDGSAIRLNFDTDTQTWSTDIDGKEYNLITFTDDNKAVVPTRDGSSMEVSLDQEGLWAYQQCCSNILMAKQ